LEAHRFVRRRGSHIFSRQSAYRWRWGCQPYAPAALYPSGIFLVLISVRGYVDPRVIVRLEGLGQLKKYNDLIGNRTRDLPTCSIVPQQTTLLRAPHVKFVLCKMTLRYAFSPSTSHFSCQSAFHRCTTCLHISLCHTSVRRARLASRLPSWAHSKSFKSDLALGSIQNWEINFNDGIHDWILNEQDKMQAMCVYSGYHFRDISSTEIPNTVHHRRKASRNIKMEPVS
jgi:hypothetical protein